MGIPPNHPFLDRIFHYEPSIFGYFTRGDFTRSWLSLPLSHGTKVKGGKKKTHFWVPSGNLNVTMENHHL